MGLGNKGVFLNAERSQIITIKYGSDQVVSDQGINTQLMDSTAYQLRQLRQHDICALLVTSGAVKYGHQLARSQEIGYELTRQEAAFLGFDEVMNAWKNSLEKVGLQSICISLTGHSLTKHELRRYEDLVNKLSSDYTFVLNTHDGLNSNKFKYHSEASNNDIVGQYFSSMTSDRYIICTNVDGVIDRSGRVIEEFSDIRQLQDIDFDHSQSLSGKGGMEVKLHSAISFAQSGLGRTAYIVNGQTEDVIVRVLRGDRIGTRVQFS